MFRNRNKSRSSYSSSQVDANLKVNAMLNENSIRLDGIEIQVSCSYRAVYYSNYLRDVVYDLQNKALSLNYLNQDFNRILTTLIEQFAAVLDEQIIKILDRDFENYRQQNNLTKNLSKEAALYHYQSYFNIHPNLINHLKNSYPFLPVLMEKLTTNYKKVIGKALKRIDFNWELLINHFVSELGENIYLSRVDSSGSDFHKQGEQVLLLTFSNTQNNEKRVVYKPSPVMADALLFGDVQQLQEIDVRYKDHFSLLELLNEQLDNPFPTYLIVPCRDEKEKFTEKEGNDEIIQEKNEKDEEREVSQENEENEQEHDQLNLASHYGFIEFLPHQPWKSLNYKALIEQILKEIEPKERLITELPQQHVNQHFADLLRQAAQDPDTDYIAENDDEVKQYSYDCGILLALMTITQMNDGHCQNFVLSKRRLLPIDGEICFTQRMDGLISTACFDPDAGGMNLHSTITETHLTLFDITGKNETIIKHIEKNRFFHLFEIDNNQIKSCGVETDIVTEGFQKAFEIFNNQKTQIENWFELPQMKQLIMRVPVLSTDDFSEAINTLYTNEFNDASYIKIKKQSVETCVAEYKVGNNINNIEIKPLIRLPQPTFAIFCNNNRSLLDDFSSLNIPVYYTLVQELKLYDSYGCLVRVPDLEAIKSLDETNINLEQFNSLPTKEYYFIISPWETTKNNALRLITNPELIEYLLSDLKECIRVGHLEKEDYNYNPDDVPELLLIVPLERIEIKENSQIIEPDDSEEDSVSEPEVERKRSCGSCCSLL